MDGCCDVLCGERLGFMGGGDIQWRRVVRCVEGEREREALAGCFIILGDCLHE